MDAMFFNTFLCFNVLTTEIIAYHDNTRLSEKIAQDLSVSIKNIKKLKILFGQWKRLRKTFSEMYFILFDLFIQKQGKE